MVNLGDCVTSPLWPRETFELLRVAVSCRRCAAITIGGSRSRPSGAELAEHCVLARRAERRPARGARRASRDARDRRRRARGARHADERRGVSARGEGRRPPRARDGRCVRRADSATYRRGAGPVRSQSPSARSRPTARVGWCSIPGASAVRAMRTMRTGSSNEAGSPHARYAIATRRGARWTSS